MSVPTALRRCLLPLPRMRPTAARRWASYDSPKTPPDNTSSAATPAAATPAARAAPSAMSTLASFLDNHNVVRPAAARDPGTNSSPTTPRRAAPFSFSGLDLQSLSQPVGVEEEYFLNIYSHKHNTHITFAKPDKDAVVSLSTGNVGFRKGNRGTYDAAYQLAAHVFKLIEEKNIVPRGVEVVFRGFGQGREAVSKALLGQEGRLLRPVLKRVSDATRLKFGGTRSKKMRRLG